MGTPNAGGGMDMDTDATGRLAKSVLDLATDLESTLTAREREIDALESGLGQGPLGREFATNYRGLSEGIKQRTRSMLNDITYQGKDGTNSVNLYVTSNEVGRQAIDGV